jgi:LAO/AO transport system kinase
LTDPLRALRTGGKAALARALAASEARPEAPEVLDLLDAAVADPRGHVLGITGPPGVGKSSLCSCLIRRFRARGLTVGAIAVDPSSRRSGGALLGDRARFEVDPEDDGVFVRSMAARERLGGLAAETRAALVLMRALFDRVIVETVGVGQSETDIALAADLVLLCVQPGSGDSLQYMKAGIAEIPDLAVVTKADLGRIADQARAELETALGFGMTGTSVPVLLVSATTEAGLDELVDTIETQAQARAQSGDLVRRRTVQHEAWAADAVRERFGRAGLDLARKLAGRAGEGPFHRAARLNALLADRLA